MAERIEPQATPTESAQPPEVAQNTDQRMIPQSRLNEVIAQRNEEREKIAAMVQAQSDKQSAELLEQNRFKELYEAELAKNEGLASAQAQANSYKERLESDNQARIERIPEDKRSLVPEYEDPIKMGKWLTDNQSLYAETAKPTAPKLDGGAGIVSTARSGDVIKLSALEVQMAQSAGMTPEDYAIGKANKGKTLT